MMVTQSADRSVRVYKKSKKGRKLFCAHHIRERETDIEVPAKKETEDHDDSPQYFHHKYFLDDSAPTFFRRPAWSPEGQFLLLPCGQVADSPTQSEPVNATWMFTRANMGKVAACCLPSNEISIAARFSPILYKSRRRSSNPTTTDANSSIPSAMEGVEESDTKDAKDAKNTFKLFDIDYRLVFAIATVSGIFIYDTEHEHPIAALQDAHYSTLTDLSFSADGNILAVSSSDGYVSLIQFDEGELGEVLDQEHYNRVMAPVLEARVPKPPEPRKSKKPSTSTDTGASANGANDQKQELSTNSAANGSSKPEGDENDDDEDDDSEVDEEEALNGTIINFDDPAAPEQEKKPAAPVVRKEGRRVVATLISAPSSTAMDFTPSEPSSNDKNAPSSS